MRKTYLSRFHKARNASQHRGAIADSLSFEEYMRWLCQFFDRYASDNFEMKVIETLPLILKRSWLKFTLTQIRKAKDYKLESPIDEKYVTVKGWLNYRSLNANRGYLTNDYKLALIHLLENIVIIKNESR